MFETEPFLKMRVHVGTSQAPFISFNFLFQQHLLGRQLHYFHIFFICIVLYIKFLQNTRT